MRINVAFYYLLYSIFVCFFVAFIEIGYEFHNVRCNMQVQNQVLQHLQPYSDLATTTTKNKVLRNFQNSFDRMKSKFNDKPIAIHSPKCVSYGGTQKCEHGINDIKST